MDSSEIIGRIDELVAEEKRLRERSSGGGPDLGDDDRARLKTLEVQLDQCWDLLRRRRAKAEFGENPDEAAARPPGEVEGYLN